MGTRRIGVVLSLLFVLALVFGACAGGSDEAAMSGGDGGTGTIVDEEGRVVGRSADGGTSMGGTGAGGGNDTAVDTGYLADEEIPVGAPAPNEIRAAERGRSGIDIGPSVIKTATLTIEVDEGSFQDSVRDGIAAAERYGGFVLTTRVEDEEEGRGSITLRVPAARFGTALADLEALGDVKSETVSGVDVSQEFIDLQARLRHLLVQENVMLDLMERAQTIPDTIRVQGQLEGIQLGIERLRGRIRYLDDQTELSTIEVRLHEVGAVAAKEGEFSKAWARAQEAFVGIIAALITSLGVIVPVAALLALVIFMISILKPRISSKTTLP
jgi:hypothetical protein